MKRTLLLYVGYSHPSIWDRWRLLREVWCEQAWLKRLRLLGVWAKITCVTSLVASDHVHSKWSHPENSRLLLFYFDHLSLWSWIIFQSDFFVKKNESTAFSKLIFLFTASQNHRKHPIFWFTLNRLLPTPIHIDSISSVRKPVQLKTSTSSIIVQLLLSVL